jgi:hypothetical protein
VKVLREKILFVHIRHHTLCHIDINNNLRKLYIFRNYSQNSLHHLWVIQFIMLLSSRILFLIHTFAPLLPLHLTWHVIWPPQENFLYKEPVESFIKQLALLQMLGGGRTIRGIIYMDLRAICTCESDITFLPKTLKY